MAKCRREMLALVVLVAVVGRCIAVPKTHKTTESTTTMKTTTAAPITTAHTTTVSTTTPTTTTTMHTTTTAVPVTTPTTAAPVTTPAPPTPLPPAETGKWALSKDNTTCIVIQMSMRLNVSYVGKDNKTAFAVFNLPVNHTTVSNGSCDSSSQYIMLNWPSSSSVSNNVTFSFVKNNTLGTFNLNEVNFAIFEDSKNFPNAAGTNVNINLMHNMNITIPLKRSYRCAKNQTIELKSASGNSTMTIADFQFQAFHEEKGNDFDSAQDCDIADLSDVVPIAVGCALGGLVLIVLITYLVGRRRRGGYLSM